MVRLLLPTTTTLLLPWSIPAASLLPSAAYASAAAASDPPGKPHETVVKLKEKTFERRLEDPANGLWLLKFYAPWCGHCKKLAPVLDEAAPLLAGKMAIGTVDCTVEKRLCDRFNVRGYPTLKYYRDGDFMDYPLGRDRDTIVNFGEKMSDRAVKIVSSHRQAKEELLDKMPVAFVVYEPASPSAGGDGDGEDEASPDADQTAEKLIQSSVRTQVFGQVARKMQASGSFGLLAPDVPAEEVAQFFERAGDVPPGGFVARIEEDVPVRLYDGELESAAFLEWAEGQNLAVVLELGGHNFRFASRRGKAMAIAVYDPDETVKTARFKRELKEYAIRGRFKDEYVYATMDGKRWDKFVAQFSIAKENLPELFIIDAPARTYWQDASVFGVSDFVAAVKNGEIASRVQEKRKDGPLEEVLQAFVDYMPWSLLGMLGLFLGVFWLALPRMGGDDLVYPPPPPPTRAPKEKEGEGNAEENGADGSNKKDR